MSVMTRTADLAGAAAAQTRPDVVARVVVHDLAGVENLWRQFEATAVATPYQRFDWIAAFSDTIGQAEGTRTLAAVAYDHCGKPTILLPLTVRRSHGLRTASILGGKHANYHMPLYEPAALAGLDTATVLRFLRLVADDIGGLDAFLFINQPIKWRGAANPFALLRGGPSPSDGYKIELDGEAAQRIIRGAAHKNLRRKEKRLATMGAVSYVQAATAAEAEAVLAAFLAHKKERFRDVGIDNPFDGPAAEAFLLKACTARIEEAKPPIELFALKTGERIVAVIGGVADEQRFSDMIISFDADPEVSRSSPGHLLIVEVMRIMARRGIATFDLGVGEAHYKTIFCDSAEPLVDACVPVTAKGAAYAAAASSARAAKRFVKQTPWAWRMAQLARARIARS